MLCSATQLVPLPGGLVKLVEAREPVAHGLPFCKKRIENFCVRTGRRVQQHDRARVDARQELRKSLLFCRLIVLVPGRSADKRAGFFEAPAAHPPGRDRAAALDVQYERRNSRCASYKMGGHGLPVREPRRALRDRRVMEPIAWRCITWNERATDATLYFRRFRYVLQ